MKDETMHALILFGVGGGEKPGANNSIFCKLSVGDASGETKAMKIKEEANIKLGLSSCNALAWQRETSRSKAR
jgi:hypothetical protein